MLKAKYNANEFLVSMMSTYVVLAFMNYLLRTFLKESKGEYPQTDALTRDAWIPTLIPVSYTHLDVYKRQVFKLRSLPGFGFAGSRRQGWTWGGWCSKQ